MDLPLYSTASMSAESPAASRATIHRGGESNVTLSGALEIKVAKPVPKSRMFDPRMLQLNFQQKFGSKILKNEGLNLQWL
jgi:hypothetical protein